MAILAWLMTLGSSTAAGAAAGSGAAWLSRQLISARLARSIGHEFDKRLASFQSDLTRQQSRESVLLSAALGPVSAAQSVIHEGRLRASKRLWSTVLEIRDCSVGISQLDILTAEELGEANRKQKVYLDKVVHTDPVVKDVLPVLRQYQGIENVRPLVSDLAWAYFFAYRALTFRVVYLLRQYAEGRAFVSPYEDTGFRQIIESVLSRAELDAVSKKVVGRMHFMRAVIEAKLLSELREGIAGRNGSEDALKHAQHIIEAVEKAEFAARRGR